MDGWDEIKTVYASIQHSETKIGLRDGNTLGTEIEQSPIFIWSDVSRDPFSKSEKCLYIHPRFVGRFGYYLPKQSYFLFYTHFQLVTKKQLLNHLSHMNDEHIQYLPKAILNDYRFRIQGHTNSYPHELRDHQCFKSFVPEILDEETRGFFWYGKPYINKGYDTGTIIDKDGLFNIDKARSEPPKVTNNYSSSYNENE